MRQILSNFISNAIKFTEKGKIEIGCKTNNKEFTFFVKDTGIGIAPKDQDYIFNRFWKIETTQSKLNPGTGLGLAISKKLAELLGGKIWLESELGKGSTFYLTLSPGAVTSTQPNLFKGNEPQATLSAPEFKNVTIAIAEDEEPNLQLLTLILKKHKLKTISFKNGKEIVDYFMNAHEKVNMVLMDIKMPEMDGYEATKHIKNVAPEVPIIAQTAYALKEDVERIKRSSFDDFLTKPIKPAQLIDKISKYIELDN